MTQFEFVTVAISMVMALGVSRLLDAIGPALRRESRSWIHVGWIGQRLFIHIVWWWSIWTARGADWDFGLFFAELFGPIVLFLQASALARPSERSPESWQDRFFEIRVPFFLGNLVLAIVGYGFLLRFHDDVPVAGVATNVALAIAGLATRDARAHGVIVALSCGSVLVLITRAVYSL